jgi:uncharacterized protein (TIGR00730 family)
MNPPRPRRTFGDETIDLQISRLIELIGTDNNDDLVRSMLVSVLDMDAEDVARLELKIANQSIAEMLNAWRVFSPYDDRSKVTIFGSARTKPDHPDYKLATEFGRLMTKRDWMSITGAGPGIMHAGIEGAGRENSFGVNIVLPFEQQANPAITDDPKLASYRYFFTRKLSFMKESDAFALFPGGFGTMDETFELLTLVQTGKSYPVPIVLIDNPESSYWDGWRNFVAKELGERGMISDHDSELFLHTHDAVEAVDYICSFYRCYHSIRYVRNQLVVRLRNPLSNRALATLNEEFGDIVAKGAITPIETTPVELRDDDHVDLFRIGFRFDNKSFARLVGLARRINELDEHGDGQSARGLLHHVGPEPDTDGETV